MKSKIVILLSLCFAVALGANAQIRLNPYYPYSDWTVGGGIGFTEIYGNLSNSNSEPAFHVNVDRNTNMYVSLGLEYVNGSLSDYEVKNTWTSGLSVYNKINAVNLNGRLALGELFKYPRSFVAKTLFGLYIGSGVGYMWNDVSNITLKFKYQDRFTIKQYDGLNMSTRTANFYVPFNVGFDLHLTKRCMFNINYQFSYAFSDYLDGYDFQAPTAKNQYNDMFSMLSFGLKFYVGKVGYHYLKHGEKKRKG